LSVVHLTFLGDAAYSYSTTHRDKPLWPSKGATTDGILELNADKKQEKVATRNPSHKRHINLSECLLLHCLNTITRGSVKVYYNN
jgi:hypothetical protein